MGALFALWFKNNDIDFGYCFQLDYSMPDSI